MKRRKETETKGVKKHRTARRRREGPEPRQESVRPVPAFAQARGPRPRRRLTTPALVTQHHLYVNVCVTD